ncbi:MAG: hypothetical protein Q7R85_03250 [bacterium]|nr:hypothetical protein [bacterium]
MSRTVAEPTVNREAFFAYLAKESKNPELVLQARELFEPLFLKAEVGKYDLSSADAVDANAIAEAFKASGLYVRQLTFVSMGSYIASRRIVAVIGDVPIAPLDADLFFDEEVWNEAMENEICWGRPYYDALFYGALGNVIGKRLDESSLRIPLCDALNKHLMDALGKGFPKRVGNELKGRFRYSIYIVPFLYAGAVIVGDATMAKSLASSMQMTANVIVVGADNDASLGDWRVIVA